MAAFAVPDAALTAFVLANPATLFRVLVLAHLGATGGGGFAAALASTGLSVGVLAAALVAWCLAPPGVAAAIIRRRGL